MRTATSKKGTAKPIPLATKKAVVQKPITTTSKTKGLKPTTPLTNPVPAIKEQFKTKQSQLIALLKGPKGSSIQELMQVTGWQAHSIRGVISGVIRKRLGLTVISQKMDGVQHYRIETA
ncbi:DUF3489 domain-containing protein [Polynucleobacter sp. 78F-HAINBA]|uniref:DUF3489 domain-containing protein n=1 Tax=Polynucleobacter sp. 78F-HAINBA TaxID=2689099 RepID=UPI001C0E5424|nr:DUF3489 domain-containing protein [Polynucleobacter sp. 78F-HAINBA]MBU3591192.1 DUF3489 domain-containing protein [Polynucleobacter sp. 78F-HAINBA]